jgi:hypothetical protein
VTKTHRANANANLDTVQRMMGSLDGQRVSTDVAIARSLNTLVFVGVAGVQALLDVADAIREGNTRQEQQ